MVEIKIGKSMDTKSRGAIKYAPWDENRGSLRAMTWILAKEVKAMNLWEIMPHSPTVCGNS